MAQCPKCGARLKITDISQFCPSCGVNMRFVNFEENFYKEAKIAELSQARMHVKIRRLKAAFIGSKLAVARLITMVLPLAALLLPAASFSISLPYKNQAFGFSALGLYSLFNEGGFNYVMEMTHSAVDAAAFTALRNALFAYAAVAVFGVLILLSSVLCFLSIKNMQKVNVAFSICGVLACAVSMIMTGKFVSVAQNSVFLTGKNGFGLILSIVMFIAVFVVNFLLVRKGIPVQYDEGMPERVEIYRKVRAGELDIDKLPQPIVETAETRKIDEEIAKEEASFKQKHEKEEVLHGNR